MATQNDFSRSFEVNAAMSAYRLVSISNNGKIGYTAINSLPVGVIQSDVTSDAFVNATVRLAGTGTWKVSATAVPLTAGDRLYSVTNGQVANTNGATGGQPIGIALETLTTGNGSIIEMLPQIT